ncbi:hypothetical protein DY000_02060124 [Brassica cretica]|uniref:Uncharacterized protein n=1 Tax=Brassica cretica TaxID=69181 RepID=A0ABQ7AZQ6_BRACR|nr:hypothetical protein DY000_02060124 [Brassica cretica]
MGEGEVNALATQTAFLKSTEHEAIRRSDIVALIKALKDNGNSLGNPLGCSLAAYRIRRVKTVTRETKLKKQQTMIMRGENPRLMHKKKLSLMLMIKFKRRYTYLRKRNVYLRVKAKKGLEERNEKYQRRRELRKYMYRKRFH